MNWTLGKKRPATSINLPKQRIKKTKSNNQIRYKSIKRNADTGIMPATAIPKPRRAKIPKTVDSTESVVPRSEKILLFALMTTIFLLGCLSAWANIEDRDTGFGLTELKKEQLDLMKEREILHQRVNTYLEPGLISKRAEKKDMHIPDPKKIVWID